jgi:hypothetical protein
MDGLMDGWMDGWMGGWMDGWMDKWVGGWMDGWMDRWRKEWSSRVFPTQCALTIHHLRDVNVCVEGEEMLMCNFSRKIYQLLSAQDCQV